MVSERCWKALYALCVECGSKTNTHTTTAEWRSQLMCNHFTTKNRIDMLCYTDRRCFRCDVHNENDSKPVTDPCVVYLGEHMIIASLPHHLTPSYRITHIWYAERFSLPIHTHHIWIIFYSCDDVCWWAFFPSSSSTLSWAILVQYRTDFIYNRYRRKPTVYC